MADTSYLTHTVEPFIVNWVSQKLGVPLAPARVVVGQTMDGRPTPFAFDGVSPDSTIGILASTSYTVKPGGTRKLYMDASVLNRAPFRRRIMVFVTADVRQNFINRCDGLVDLAGIEMLVCDALSPEMIARIAVVQSDSKAEVGDKGKVWKVGNPRR
jgi:hypothetical protein